MDKSHNAWQAEAEGRFPLCEATRRLAKTAGVTQRAAREILKAIGTREWHHVSAYANRVDYYDVGGASDLVAEARLAGPADLLAGVRVVLSTRLAQRQAALDASREAEADHRAWLRTPDGLASVAAKVEAEAARKRRNVEHQDALVAISARRTDLRAAVRALLCTPPERETLYCQVSHGFKAARQEAIDHHAANQGPSLQ